MPRHSIGGDSCSLRIATMGEDEERRRGKLRATYTNFSQIAQRLAAGITTGGGFSLDSVADDVAQAALDISGAEVAYIRVPGFWHGEEVLNVFSDVKWCRELRGLSDDNLKRIAGTVPAH